LEAKLLRKGPYHEQLGWLSRNGVLVIWIGEIDLHTEHHGLGGRQYGASAKDGEATQTQDSPSDPRPGTVEKRGVEFARGTQFASILQPRNRRVYLLVLLRATRICLPFGGVRILDAGDVEEGGGDGVADGHAEHDDGA
jgi:hypothetical protein